MDDRRLQRVNQLYYQELAQLVLIELNEPKLAGVEITKVQITSDLRLARVYFTIHGGREKLKDAYHGLKRSKSFLKRELSSRIKLKFVPDLEFIFDETLERIQRVEELFYELDKEKKQRCPQKSE